MEHPKYPGAIRMPIVLSPPQEDGIQTAHYPFQRHVLISPLISVPPHLLPHPLPGFVRRHNVGGLFPLSLGIASYKVKPQVVESLPCGGLTPVCLYVSWWISRSPATTPLIPQPAPHMTWLLGIKFIDLKPIRAIFPSLLLPNGFFASGVALHAQWRGSLHGSWHRFRS